MMSFGKNMVLLMTLLGASGGGLLLWAVFYSVPCRPSIFILPCLRPAAPVAGTVGMVIGAAAGAVVGWIVKFFA